MSHVDNLGIICQLNQGIGHDYEACRQPMLKAFSIVKLCDKIMLFSFYVHTDVKPGNKNQKLGTLGDFEFVVDYASMISLDTVFKIS